MKAKYKGKTLKDSIKEDKILSNLEVEILHPKKDKAMSYMWLSITKGIHLRIKDIKNSQLVWIYLQ